MDTRFYAAMMMAVSLVALSACGGGGGTATSSSQPSGSASPPAATAQPPTTTAPPPASTSGFSARASATPAPADSTSSPVYGIPYMFTGSVSGGTTPYNYFWNFGDGATATGSLSPSHTYAGSGPFTALLAVTDAVSHVAAATAIITIPHTVPTVSVSGPPAGNTGTPITFIAAPATANVTDWFVGFTYKWDFGDGTTTTGTEQTPEHTFTAPGTYTVSVTATDTEGATSAAGTTQIVISTPNIITVDQNWLTQNGPAPYVLNQTGATYQLQTDVTADGTAFVVLAANVTLDLNGHTVTYGNSAPITVPNGGFESGSGTNIPDWNISGAPAAALAPNTNYLWGNQVLRLSNFSTAQTIISNPIAISFTNHTYEATVTMANPNVDYRTVVQLSVIDATTGKVLGSGTSANPERGFSAVAPFTPTTTDPVELQVVVTPPAGVADQFLDLDAATLGVSYDYGIVAAHAWSGQFPAFANFPAAVQSSYATDYLKAANFTVRNGSILQGQGDGASSSPLYVAYLDGLAVDHVTTYDTGTDTTNVEAEGVAGNATISNSTFQDDILNVTDRMAGPATIQFNSTTANILVEGNQILGSPQEGISVAVNNGYTLIISGNHISQNTMVADSAGIGIVGVSNFQIVGNTIIPKNGEGIHIDGYTGTPTTYGLIRDNDVQAQEGPNRETGNGNFARALRLRNTDGPDNSAQTDIDISGNTFIAEVNPGGALTAYAAWITYINPVGAMDNANVNLHDNTIEALVNTTDPSYHGAALVIDGSDAGINLRVWNNLLESNDTSLSIGGYNDRTINGVTLTGNTLDELANAPARNYTGIQVGYWQGLVSNVKILNTQLQNGATENLNWVGPAAKSITQSWQVTVHVSNGDGSAAAGAVVEVQNASGGLVYAGVTDASGNTTIILGTTLYRQTGTDPAQITTTSLNPYSITATLGAKTTTVSVSPTAAQTIPIQLN